MKQNRNQLTSTDLSRDEFSYNDDPDSWKERIVMFITCTLMGMVFGVAAIMIYFNVTGQLCSASPYCSVHKK